MRGRHFVLLSLVLASIATGAARAQQPSLWPPREDKITQTVPEFFSDAPPSLEVRPVVGGLFDCQFAFQPTTAVKAVNIAGDFNGWSTTATPMSRGDDGVWRTTIQLLAGERLYKFVVDGKNWVSDPRNLLVVDDGNGGNNSLLRLGVQANLARLHPRVADGKIAGSGVLHDPSKAAFVQKLTDGRLLVRVRTLRNDIEAVEFAAMGSPRLPMRDSGSDQLFSWWEVAIAPPRGPVPYTFLFSDGATRLSDSRIYSLTTSPDALFTTPAWAKDAVWYQLMLERFRDGDPLNNPEPCRPWTSEWYTASDWEAKDGQSFFNWYVFSRHYGGDLAGLRNQLPYLKDLGINALYLNPIFQATTHHKYNATSFIHVDEHFGTRGDYEKAEAVEDLRDPTTWTWTATDRLFLEVLRGAKALGIRVILDGVFNHVGTAHPAFRDVQARKEASPYRDWFSIRSWDPFEYDGWAGFQELPVFRKNDQGFTSDEVKQHIFNVTRRWMDPNGDGDPSDGIDGWRLDVPNEVAMPFWHQWRTLVKSINPDAYIVGEVWRRADSWLDGRSFDAVMNYPFAEAVLQWIRDKDRKITASELDRRLAELRHAYPAQATYVLQNLVDSHDTDRLVSKLRHPDSEYDKGNREQENAGYQGGKPSDREYKRARLIALIQMVYVGAPLVYYGDEVGMWGADDPTNRKPMLWKDLEPFEKPEENRVDSDHLACYKRMIALRNAHPALRGGSFESVLCDDAQDVWVFLRKCEGETLLVAINASEHEARLDLTQTTIGSHTGRWRTIFGGEGAAIVDDAFPKVSVAALSGRVWLLEP
ncbi:MAG: DUF3459 domain-containing protein [Phycisphaerales bacterium]|nr:DUF3459 domain-containing protein [Phycisphaerales bacterium]